MAVAIAPGEAYALAAIDARQRDAAAAPQVAAWLRWCENRLVPGTVSAYSYRADRLLAMYPDLALEDFTIVELETVLSQVGKYSKRLYVTVFKSLFRSWALRRNLIATDPTILLDEIRTAKQKYMETFSEAEVEKLTGLGGEDGFRMLMFFDTGLRIGELCRLRVGDVQPERRQLVVLGSQRGGGGKGDKDRVVDITDRLVQAFTDWQLVEAPKPNEYVFGHRQPGPQRRRGAKSPVVDRSTPLTSEALRSWWYHTLEDAGVRRLKPHTSRHTYATMLIRRGAPISHVSKLLGHKSIQTTIDQYTHLTSDDLRWVVDLLVPTN